MNRRLGLVALLGALVLASACGADTEKGLADAALARGLDLQVAGNLAGAAEQYEVAILHDPQSKLAYYDLGLVWQLQSRPVDAEVDYRRALAIDGEYTPALFNLALLRTAGDPAEAERLYRHVLRIRPNDAPAHYNLGVLLRSQGRVAEGAAEIAQAIAINPRLAPSPSPRIP